MDEHSGACCLICRRACRSDLYFIIKTQQHPLTYFFLEYARELCIVALSRKSLRKDTGDAVAGHYIHSLSATF